MEKLSQTTQTLLLQRFGHDSILALATVDGELPAVRNVDAFYQDGAFYVLTYALSGKMQQLKKNPNVALAGEWFTARGIGENLGSFCAEENKEMAQKIREVYAAWIDNGHNDLTDPNTCILRIRLTEGILFADGTRYEIDFT